MPEQHLKQQNHSPGTEAESSPIVLRGGFLNTGELWRLSGHASELQLPACPAARPAQRYSSRLVPLRTTTPGVPRSRNARPPAGAHGSCSPSPGAVCKRGGSRWLREEGSAGGVSAGERSRRPGPGPEQEAAPPPATTGGSAAARTGCGGRDAGSRLGSRPAAPVMPRGGARSSRVGREAAAPRSGLGGFSPALDRREGAKRRRSEPGAACPSVRVSFPGAVSRESGCRFAVELLKHVLYQRQQLPLPYERLGCFCRRDEDASKKPPFLDPTSKKCQQLLTDLEGLFQHMEVMFSLTRVPRVLFLLGGNVMSPKELYELNLESICEGSAEESLETASCVRKLFHSLFVADVFSELEDLPVVGTVVMLLGHRGCGVDWFRPKLNYKVPTRGRKLTVNLSCDGGIDVSALAHQHMASAWEDYVWFQAPVTLKGFRECPVLCGTLVGH
ncbi:MAD2L1-binding protein-like [Phaenicophaeus curvirostris]|uniref:MAD2L1-binding protein-like n=1 Tax=Phaenicophaeus curvirostris TaxID=33595 RepID=UPI0037F0C8E1